jgi:DNA-binding response OmpR family regulator
MPYSILIVNGEDHIRRILTFQLEKHQYAVHVAAGPDDTIQMISVESPDLIVIASSTLSLDGTALCRTIRRDSSFDDIPIILMSSKSDLLNRLEAIQAGAIDFISLPYSNEEFLLRIARILDYREKVRGRRASALKKPSIFVSYSHADVAFVDGLVSDLSSSGHDIWIDRAELKIGESLINRISQAVMAVDYVLAILSKSSIRSPWVSHELKLAMSREISGKRIIVLPVLVDDVGLPDYLCDKYYADFRDPNAYDAELAKILHAVQP